jgi:hypothetical protein
MQFAVSWVSRFFLTHRIAVKIRCLLTILIEGAGTFPSNVSQLLCL